MKKIVIITLTMVFTLALGLAYAGDNAVTDFTGRSYDMFELARAAEISHVEGTAAGGLRAGEAIEMLHNGITDFAGRSYDAGDIGPAGEVAYAEGSGPGGLRAVEAVKDLSNGVTDFTGRSHEEVKLSL